MQACEPRPRGANCVDESCFRVTTAQCDRSEVIRPDGALPLRFTAVRASPSADLSTNCLKRLREAEHVPRLAPG
jgi:hypothetical protein